MTAAKPPTRAFSGLCAAAAFLLIAAGGMVTSTGSGLAVPDWPLSFGKAMPPMVGGIFFEHGHRMIAGAVSILTWTLAVWTWMGEPRRWVRILAAIAAAGILAQAVLGGLTVLYGLPPAVSALHACLGQALFCALLLLWDSTVDVPRSDGGGGSWRVGAFAAAAMYAQLVFGAVYRHSGHGLSFHLGGALVATIAAAALLRSALGAGEVPILAAPAHWLIALLPVQLALGLASLALRGRRFSPRVAADAGLGGVPAGVYPSGYFLPSAVTALHVAFGAALLGAAVLWTARALRREGMLA